MADNNIIYYSQVFTLLVSLLKPYIAFTFFYRYYKTKAVLPPTWKYESATASALVA